MQQYYDYITNLKKGEQLYILKKHVKQIEIKNMPFSKDKKIIFDKYNILQSEYSYSNTFLIKLIYHAYLFGFTNYKFFLDIGYDKETITEVEFNTIANNEQHLADKKERTQPNATDTNEEKTDFCLILDEPDIMNDDKGSGILNYLKGGKMQIIISTNQNQTIDIPEEYKIINL